MTDTPLHAEANLSWQRVRALLGLQQRELLRDKRSFWFAFLFPFALLGMFLVIFGNVGSYTDGGGATEQVIAMTLFMSVTSIAFLATASPLATLRRDGVLRLLGTTPASRIEFLLTHLPVRLAVVIFQVVAILLIGVALGAVEPAQIMPAVGASLLGLLMFGALGYLLGGILPGPDAASNLGTFVQLATFFLSGLVFPLDSFPGTMETILTYMPFTFFADLLMGGLVGVDPLHPWWLSVLVILTSSVVLSIIAARLFKWEDVAK